MYDCRCINVSKTCDQEKICTKKKAIFSVQCFIQAPFGGEVSLPPDIETPPQEFSATPAVKLKIMSVLD